MRDPLLISIIIPTLNEGRNIVSLITFLKTGFEEKSVEIIVSDGQSNDDTVLKAKNAGAKVILCPTKGRAYQMNFAASIANGQILYFLHADTVPPITFKNDILKAVEEGFDLGRYRTKFQSNSLLLKMNSFFTRFDFTFCYGGDQTLFIRKELFDRIGGFNSDMRIMEDYDIVKRARKLGTYKILRSKVLVSARKYMGNSWLKVQLANLKIMKMFQNGASQEEMIRKYNEIITYR